MAHLTETIPTSAHNVGSLWGFFGEVDNTQWQWEPPTTRNSTMGSAAALPAWLEDWDTSPQVVPEVAIEDSTSEPLEEALSMEEDILGFRRKLRAVIPDEIPKICDEFNQRFKQNLRLGLVSEATIHGVLKTISRDIRLVSSNLGLEGTPRLLSFYQAFWGGVISCKVLQPVDLDARIMNRFLFRLGNLPICTEVQILFHSVMHVVSITQLCKMKKGLEHLVRAWALSWLHEHSLGDSHLFFLSAERALSESSTNLGRLHKLVHRGENDDLLDLSKIQEACKEAKARLDRALESIVEAEKVVIPFKGSIEALAGILSCLPRDLLCPLLDSCTYHIIRIHNSIEDPLAEFHHGWLSLVAKIPKLPDKIFVDIVRRMGHCTGATEHLIPGDVVLSRWISQGYVREGALVRNTFELSALDSGPHDLGSVLFAIDKHREKVYCKTQDLFKLLNDLERYKHVYGVLGRMQNLGLKLPRDIIGPTIEIMSKYDLKLAYRIYGLFYSGLIDGKGLQPHLMPNFIISMVNDYKVSPRRIWKVMGIPVYDHLQPSKRSAFSRERLSPATIGLVTKLAIAFAQTHARPQRVAFRNVVRCLHHLRRHNAPITRELTRAISHAGFTRKIIAGQRISKELLNWVLGLVEVAEGTDVAVITDRAVTYWNEQLLEDQWTKERAKAREMNVLRVGPIN
jgi:hypothetical protein